jgi:branched-subunit amino acid ABC-type transport system permease component
MYFFGGRITSVQLLSILVALALWFLLMAVLAWTRWGRVTRGVMSDQELASVAGIPGDAVILCVSFTASLLAATGGILQALDVDMTPTMGLPALLAGVVAALVGGIGKLPGALLGAALLGIAQQFSVWGIGAQWQDVSAFVVLLVLLVVRPEGFLGRKIRKAAV